MLYVICLWVACELEWQKMTHLKKKFNRPAEWEFFFKVENIWSYLRVVLLEYVSWEHRTKDCHEINNLWMFSVYNIKT